MAVAAPQGINIQQVVNDVLQRLPGFSQATQGQVPDTSIPNPLNVAGGWLSSLGGSIGSGLEGAFVAFLKDLWDVILGPLEIIAGAVLGILILLYAFKDDLMAVAPLLIK